MLACLLCMFAGVAVGLVLAEVLRPDPFEQLFGPAPKYPPRGIYSYRTEPAPVECPGYIADPRHGVQPDEASSIYRVYRGPMLSDVSPTYMGTLRASRNSKTGEEIIEWEDEPSVDSNAGADRKQSCR